jgi:putative endonuclease
LTNSTGRHPIDGRKALGQWGEELAAGYLASQGYKIVERNWRSRAGELDIIAEAEGVLIFVEVRTRRSTARFGTPAESVDARKQRQVREIAQLYLHMTRKHEVRCRFDVVAITSQQHPDSSPDLRHIPNAF